jgi:hypothetical protein
MVGGLEDGFLGPMGALKLAARAIPQGCLGRLASAGQITVSGLGGGLASTDQRPEARMLPDAMVFRAGQCLR